MSLFLLKTATYLRSVGTGSGVGHGQNPGAGVLQVEVLVGEVPAVDGLAPGAVVVGEVTTLEINKEKLQLINVNRTLNFHILCPFSTREKEA